MDECLAYILDQVALDGAQGAEPTRFSGFIHEYYSRSGQVQLVDDAFTSLVWDLLIGHKDFVPSEKVENGDKGTIDYRPCETALQSLSACMAHYGDRLRLCASYEHQWQALTGGPPDPIKIPKSQFALLGGVSRHRERGIALPLLYASVGQDKRSAPQRCKSLAEIGLIRGTDIIHNKSQTVLYTHWRYLEGDGFTPLSVVTAARNGPDIELGTWRIAIMKELHKHPNNTFAVQDLLKVFKLDDKSVHKRKRKHMLQQLHMLAHNRWIDLFMSPAKFDSLGRPVHTRVATALRQFDVAEAQQQSWSWLTVRPLLAMADPAEGAHVDPALLQEDEAAMNGADEEDDEDGDGAPAWGLHDPDQQQQILTFQKGRSTENQIVEAISRSGAQGTCSDTLLHRDFGFSFKRPIAELLRRLMPEADGSLQVEQFADLAGCWEKEMSGRVKQYRYYSSRDCPEKARARFPPVTAKTGHFRECDVQQLHSASDPPITALVVSSESFKAMQVKARKGRASSAATGSAQGSPIVPKKRGRPKKVVPEDVDDDDEDFVPRSTKKARKSKVAKEVVDLTAEDNAMDIAGSPEVINVDDDEEEIGRPKRSSRGRGKRRAAEEATARTLADKTDESLRASAIELDTAHTLTALSRSMSADRRRSESADEEHGRIPRAIRSAVPIHEPIFESTIEQGSSLSAIDATPSSFIDPQLDPDSARLRGAETMQDRPKASSSAPMVAADSPTPKVRRVRLKGRTPFFSEDNDHRAPRQEALMQFIEQNDGIFIFSARSQRKLKDAWSEVSGLPAGLDKRPLLSDLERLKNQGLLAVKTVSGAIKEGHKRIWDKRMFYLPDVDVETERVQELIKQDYAWQPTNAHVKIDLPVQDNVDFEVFAPQASQEEAADAPPLRSIQDLIREREEEKQQARLQREAERLAAKESKLQERLAVQEEARLAKQTLRDQKKLERLRERDVAKAAAQSDKPSRRPRKVSTKTATTEPKTPRRAAQSAEVSVADNDEEIAADIDFNEEQVAPDPVNDESVTGSVSNSPVRQRTRRLRRNKTVERRMQKVFVPRHDPDVLQSDNDTEDEHEARALRRRKLLDFSALEDDSLIRAIVILQTFFAPDREKHTLNLDWAVVNSVVPGRAADQMHARWAALRTRKLVDPYRQFFESAVFIDGYNEAVAAGKLPALPEECTSELDLSPYVKFSRQFDLRKCHVLRKALPASIEELEDQYDLPLGHDPGINLRTYFNLPTHATRLTALCGHAFVSRDNGAEIENQAAEDVGQDAEEQQPSDSPQMRKSRGQAETCADDATNTAASTKFSRALENQKVRAAIKAIVIAQEVNHDSDAARDALLSAANGSQALIESELQALMSARMLAMHKTRGLSLRESLRRWVVSEQMRARLKPLLPVRVYLQTAEIATQYEAPGHVVQFDPLGDRPYAMAFLEGVAQDKIELASQFAWTTGGLTNDYHVRRIETNRADFDVTLHGAATETQLAVRPTRISLDDVVPCWRRHGGDGPCYFVGSDGKVYPSTLRSAIALVFGKLLERGASTAQEVARVLFPALERIEVDTIIDLLQQAGAVVVIKNEASDRLVEGDAGDGENDAAGMEPAIRLAAGHFFAMPSPTEEELALKKKPQQSREDTVEGEPEQEQDAQAEEDAEEQEREDEAAADEEGEGED